MCCANSTSRLFSGTKPRPEPGISCPALLSASVAPGWFVSIRMVRLPSSRAKCSAASSSCRPTPRPWNSGRMSRVNSARSRLSASGRAMSDGSHDLAVDPGHQDHLAFIGIRHLQQLLQRGVGQVIAPPGLHPDLPAHFDGGKEVRCIRSVQRIRDPELLDPYLVCHSGHVPSHPAAKMLYRLMSGPARAGLPSVSICPFGPAFHGADRRISGPPRRAANSLRRVSPPRTDGLLPLPVPAGRHGIRGRR